MIIMNKFANKILIVFFLLCSLLLFALSRFITERNFILMAILALTVALSAEKPKRVLITLISAVVIVLEFLHILPSPYNFLFSHGLSMGPAIVVTLFVLTAYVIIPIWLVFWRFSSKESK